MRSGTGHGDSGATHELGLGAGLPEGAVHNVLNGCVYLCLPLKKQTRKVLSSPHVIDEKTEAQRG